MVKKALTTVAFLLLVVLLALLLRPTTAGANPIPCCTSDIVRESGDRGSLVTLEFSISEACIEVPSDDIAIVLRRNGVVIDGAEWSSEGTEDGILFRYVDSDVSGGFYWYEASADIGETPCDLEIGVLGDSSFIPPPSPDGGAGPVDAGRDASESPVEPELRDGGQFSDAIRGTDETNGGGSGNCSIKQLRGGNGLGAVAVVIFGTGIIALRPRRKRECGSR